jgi:hypothetical protein
MPAEQGKGGKQAKACSRVIEIEKGRITSGKFAAASRDNDLVRIYGYGYSQQSQGVNGEPGVLGKQRLKNCCCAGPKRSNDEGPVCVTF